MVQIIKRDSGSVSPNIGKNFEHNIIIKLLLDNFHLQSSFFLYQYLLDIAFFDLFNKELTIIEAKATIQETKRPALSINEIYHKIIKFYESENSLDQCHDFHEWKINHWIWTNKRILLSTRVEKLDMHYIDKKTLFVDLSPNVQNHFYQKISPKVSDSNYLKKILQNVCFNVSLKNLQEFENEIKATLAKLAQNNFKMILTIKQIDEIHDLIRELINKIEQRIFDTEIIVPRNIADLINDVSSIKTVNLIKIIKQFDDNSLGDIQAINQILLDLIANSNQIENLLLKTNIKNLSELDDYQYILNNIYKAMNRLKKFNLAHFLNDLKNFFNDQKNCRQETLIALVLEKLLNDYQCFNNLNLFLYNPIELMIISLAIVLKKQKGNLNAVIL